MDNLVEAQVHLLVTEDEINRVRAPHDDEFFGLDEGLDDPILLFPNVGKLMNGIRNVKYLDLEPDTLRGKYFSLFFYLLKLVISSKARNHIKLVKLYEIPPSSE